MKQGVDDFVVESTPVLDLKKQNLSSAPQAHVSEPGWDADRTEVYADIDESDAVASLVADSGESYPITTFPFVIGRGSECDLVLQGKGISRRHVEIVFQSGRFVVNDLESLNGLKVNGYKVARVILEENDSIKLGEVTLEFRSGASATEEVAEEKPKKAGLFSKSSANEGDADDTFGPSPTKKLLTNSIILLALVIFAAAGYVYMMGQQNPQPQIAQLPPQGSTNTQNQAPAPAAPAQPQTRKAPPQAPAQTASQTQQPASAPVSNTAPPPPPSFAPPPSIASAPSAPAAPKVAPAEPAAPVVQAPPPPKPKPKPVNLNDKAQLAIGKAERLYFSGRGSDALKTLKPYIGSASVTGATKKSVLKSYQDIEFLYGQYTEAQSAFSSGDKNTAFSLWTDFMAREQKLYDGRKSSYSKQIAGKVVDEYVNKGNIASSNGDYHSAYNYWQKAVSLGDSAPAKIAIDNLTTRAQQLYRQALRLEYVNSNKAKSMWREVTNLLPPGTEYHTKASSKLAWYEKWGS